MPSRIDLGEGLALLQLDDGTLWVVYKSKNLTGEVELEQHRLRAWLLRLLRSVL